MFAWIKVIINLLLPWELRDRIFLMDFCVNEATSGGLWWAAGPRFGGSFGAIE